MSLPIAVVPLYNCMRFQEAEDWFSASPVAVISTGLPVVVIVTLAIVNGYVEPLGTFILVPAVVA